jgi:hypothetical protein
VLYAKQYFVQKLILFFYIIQGVKKKATSEFPKKSTLQFLSIKDFRPLGIEIELLIDHITAVVSKHFIVDVELGRVGVATKDRTSQLGGSDGMLPENFGLV